MTKTMKKVLIIALIGVMALSTCLFGTSVTSKALSVKATEFETIVSQWTGVTGDVDNSLVIADLADENVRKDLIKAKTLYDEMAKSEYDELGQEVKDEWTHTQIIAGPALETYMKLNQLNVYVGNGASKISIVFAESNVSTGKVMFEALSTDYEKGFVDMAINYDDPATTGEVDPSTTAFISEIERLIAIANNAIQDAIDAIDAIWLGIEDIGLDREDEVNEATDKIALVHPEDKVRITNLQDYEDAVDAIAAIKAPADALALAIDAFYPTLQDRTNFDGNEIYYSKKTIVDEVANSDIDEIKATFDGFSATTENNVQNYFATTYPTQKANLDAMVEYVGVVATEIQNVIDAIDAIGTVVYTDACNTLITTAEHLYEELDNDVKSETYITNYSALTAARTKYNALKAAIDPVVEKINAIGTVVLTEACETLIIDAETAYDALDDLGDDYKANVPADKVTILTTARTTFDELKATAEQWMEDVVALIYEEGATVTDFWAADKVEADRLISVYTTTFGDAERAWVDAKYVDEPTNTITYKQHLDAIYARAFDMDVNNAYGEVAGNIAEMEGIFYAIVFVGNGGINVEALLAAKAKFDALHSTQQALVEQPAIDNFNYFYGIYNAGIYFDKAVAEIKANVDAGKYFDHDKAMAYTLLAFYQASGDTLSSVVTTYDALLAATAKLEANATVDAGDVNAKLEKAIADMKTAYDSAIAALEGKVGALETENGNLKTEIENLKAELDKANAAIEGANGTATIGMVIAIIGVIAAIVAIVLVFVKKN